VNYGWQASDLTSPHAMVPGRTLVEGALPPNDSQLLSRRVKDPYHYESSRREGFTMANLLVRDLDEEVLKRLKAAAKAHGRSLQAEIHHILQRASTRNLAETRRLSAPWLKRLRESQSDSSGMVREDRDQR
jgi:plasmid stability protein